MTDPEALMRVALGEAARGRGFTAPNPAVGALVVKEGRIIGRGFHPRAGAPHAEARALEDAGEAARGADLYVTLEPCSTRGRTPPCTEAVLEAGIRRVWVGCTDPNPAHAGRAYALLREAGVEVMEDVLREECEEFLRAFIHVQRTGLPYVTLKMACSLDGRIADAGGRSQWITGPDCRERVQTLRREVDAVLVGTGTVEADDPSLLPRPAEGRRPWRVVPDRTGRLRLGLRVFTDEARDRTLCVLGGGVSEERRRVLEERGVSWVEGAARDGALDWPEVMRKLRRRGVCHVLCEGGGRLAGALLREDLVEELIWTQAPMVLGAEGAASVAGDFPLAEARRWTLRSVEPLGGDVWMRLTK